MTASPAVERTLVDRIIHESTTHAGPKPDTTGAATRTLAVNTAHLTRLRRDTPYPPSS